MNRHFKGVWIPKEICLMTELSANARVLWAEIDSLYCEEKGGCYASDKYLMNFLGLSLSGLHRVLKELKKANIIVCCRQTGSRVIQLTNRKVTKRFVLQNSKIWTKHGINRNFKGVWIPREIWLMTELSANARVLWAEIDSLYCKEKGGCYASDKYLMNFLGLRISRLHEVLKELKKHGLIVNINDKGDNEFKNRGRNRVIKAIHPLAEKLVKQEDNLPESEKSTFQETGSQPSGKREDNLPESEKSTFQETGSPIYKDYSKGDSKEEGEIKTKHAPPISSTSSAKNEQKNSYGEFHNVNLTQTEYDKLQTRIGQENRTRLIKRLDFYVGQTGKRYKSHYMTILKWNDEDVEKNKKTTEFSLPKHRQGSKLAFETEKDTWTPPELKPREITPEEKAQILKEFGVAL